MKRILLFASYLLVSVGAKAQLFINEISHGANGNKDYIEFVVAGTRSCSDSTMDLRGIIVDDNAGWYGIGSFNAGCFRFANNSSWSAVPYGSIILVYNSDDKNASIALKDDPTDANHDYVYILADSSQYLDVSASPAVLDGSFDYNTAISGSWLTVSAGSVANTLGLDDSTDVVSIINPFTSTTTAAHSVGWGWLSAGGTQTPGIQFSGVSGGGFNLFHTGNSPATQNLWAVGSAASGPNDETPCAGNTGANTEWIESMRVQATVPDAPMVILGPGVLCAGVAETYTIAPVAGATSYKWNVPGTWAGSSTDTSISLTVTGTDVISVEAENGCGSSAATTLSVTAMTPPATPTAIIGNTTVCAGSNVTLSVPSVGTPTLVWITPGGWTGVPTGNSIDCNVGSAGGTVFVMDTNMCGASAPAALAVTVNAYVMPSVSLSTLSSTVCNGAATTFNASPVYGGSTASYQWLINGYPIAVSGSSFSFNTFNTGDSVSVVLKSSEECLITNDVPSNAITMTVLPMVVPNIKVTAFPGTPICQGTVVSFTTSIINGGPTPSFAWYKNGVIIPGAVSSKYSTSNIGNGDIIYAALISSESCPTVDTVAGNPITLTVNPTVNPAATITASRVMPIPVGAAVTFTASYSGGGSAPGFQWMKNGNPIPFETASVYTTSNVRQNDTISVRMTSHDACAANAVVTSNKIRVSNTFSAGIDNTNAEQGVNVSLYPNPNNGRFTINIDRATGNSGERATVEVLNVMGQTVYQTELPINSAHTNVNISLAENIARGMYQLRLRTNNMQTTRPLVIQ